MTKNIKNIPLMLILVIFIAFIPSSGFAETIEPNQLIGSSQIENLSVGDTIRCEDTALNSKKLTEQIIDCFNKPVRDASLRLLTDMSNLLSNILIAAIVIAVAVFGIKMMGGEPNIAPLAFSLILRIGIALFLVYELGGYGSSLFDIFDEVVGLMSGGFSPWQIIDNFITNLLNFTSTSNGESIIQVLLEGSFFSRNFGVMLSIVGVFAILSVLMFIFQALYLYISAILALAFLIIISPLVVPFLLFYYTDRMFTKWMDLVIYTFLAPGLMFAFMSIFLTTTPATATSPAVPGVFDGITQTIFNTLGSNFIQQCLHTSQPVTPATALSTDSSAHNKLSCIAQGNATCAESKEDRGSLQAQNVSYLQKGLNAGAVLVPIIDCGDNINDPTKDDSQIKRNLLLQFLYLLIFTVLMNSMLAVIPSLASNLSRGAATGITNLSSPMASAVNVARMRAQRR